MVEITIRPRARTDLEGTWDYTAETWGRQQATTYVVTLNEAFEALQKDPKIGRVYDEVREGLRVYPSGKHPIFYFRTDGGIDIVRVLHERMDILWHI